MAHYDWWVSSRCSQWGMYDIYSSSKTPSTYVVTSAHDSVHRNHKHTPKHVEIIERDLYKNTSCLHWIIPQCCQNRDFSSHVNLPCSLGHVAHALLITHNRSAHHGFWCGSLFWCWFAQKLSGYFRGLFTVYWTSFSSFIIYTMLNMQQNV